MPIRKDRHDKIRGMDARDLCPERRPPDRFSFARIHDVPPTALDPAPCSVELPLKRDRREALLIHPMIKMTESSRFSQCPCCDILTANMRQATPRPIPTSGAISIP